MALNSGSFSRFGPLVAPGGDGAVESLDPPDYGSGGSGGGHSFTGTGSDGGTGGSDAFGEKAGIGQGTREFRRAIDVRGVDGLRLSAGRGGRGGDYSLGQTQGGGGGGGGVLVNGASPEANAAQDGEQPGQGGAAGDGYGAGGGAGALQTAGLRVVRAGGHGADGVVVVIYCAAGRIMSHQTRDEYTCCSPGQDCTPAQVPSLPSLLPAGEDLNGGFNVVANLRTGGCQFDDCVCSQWSADGSECLNEGSCSVPTDNAGGGGVPGINGVRRCGAVSSSTVGWGGEP
eukprot:COSAG02_NODE_8523_length_2537_cov_34.997539_1_plen_285_part_10